MKHRYAILCAISILATSAHAQQSDPDSQNKKPTIDDLAISTAPSKVTGAPFTPPGIAPMSPSVLGGRQYFTPTPAGQVVVEFDGAQTTFGAIDSTKMGTFLSQVDESLEIEQFDASGTGTTPIAGGSVNKGNYRVTYYYYRYRTVPCPGGPGSGGIAIGVGLRVTATFKSVKTNVSVSGFMPLAIAASASKISGKIRIEQSGISSGTGAISSYLSGASDMSPESIRKAVESFGIVKAVFETPSLTLTPYYLFVESNDIGKCLAPLVPKQ